MITALRLILVMCCAVLMNGCQNTAPLSQSADTFNVLVVNSDRNVPRYTVPEQAFQKMMTQVELIQVDLTDDEHPTETLQDVLNTHRVDAIYCIGAKALGSVDYLSPRAPVVYSSVLSWREFIQRKQFYGVTDGVAPAAQLAWFKHFFPDIKTIGVLYSDTSKTVLDDVHHSAEALSLTIRAHKLSDSADRDQQVSSLVAGAEALWVLPDPVVLNSESNTVRLFEAAHQHQIPVFTYNQFFMDLGATLSINADLATTGRQAALMVHSLRRQVEPENPVQFPAGSNISLNLQKARQYQLELNPEALNSVSELLVQ